MIYVIPDFLLIFVEADMDHFIKELLINWKKDRDLIRHNFFIPRGNYFKRKFTNLRNILMMKNHIRKENYEILFVEWGKGLLKHITTRFKIKRPLITRMHRYEIYEETLFEINFNKVDRIILVSEFIKRELLKRIPGLEEKIVIIPNAVNLKEFYPDEKQEKSYKICALTSLIDVKRIDLIIDAMKYINNKSIKLHVGGDGELETELRNKIKQENLEDQIILDGRITKVREWFKDKDIIINSSNIESFGVSLIEGMACGVLPLVRGWEAAKEIFPNEFILPYKEDDFVKSLVSRIDEFYQLENGQMNEKRRLVMDLVTKKYSLKQQLQRFNDLFRSLQYQ